MSQLVVTSARLCEAKSTRWDMIMFECIHDTLLNGNGVMGGTVVTHIRYRINEYILIFVILLCCIARLSVVESCQYYGGVIYCQDSDPPSKFRCDNKLPSDSSTNTI